MILIFTFFVCTRSRIVIIIIIIKMQHKARCLYKRIKYLINTQVRIQYTVPT